MTTTTPSTIKKSQTSPPIWLKLENKIHKVVKFWQKILPWLNSYIEFNTKKKKKANHQFIWELFQFVEQLSFRQCRWQLYTAKKYRVIKQWKKIERTSTASSAFSSFKIFTEGLVAVERRKIILRLSRPIYVGFSILELLKLHI